LKGINQELFLRKAPGRKPLLTVYLVALNTNGNEELEKAKAVYDKPVVGLSIALPFLSASDGSEYVDYKINKTLWRQWFEQETDDYPEQEEANE